jgi:hypothetical protein
MAGHGLLGDAQDLADLPVCLAASDEIDAFDLSRGQRRAQMHGLPRMGQSRRAAPKAAIPVAWASISVIGWSGRSPSPTNVQVPQASPGIEPVW